MASASGSASVTSSSAQHIEVDVEEDIRSSGANEGLDEEMGGSATPGAEGTQTPQSQADSELAPSFYQNNSTKKRQTGSKLAHTNATAVDDDDDMMEPELPGREERVSFSISCGSRRISVLVSLPSVHIASSLPRTEYTLTLLIEHCCAHTQQSLRRPISSSTRRSALATFKVRVVRVHFIKC